MKSKNASDNVLIQTGTLLGLQYKVQAFLGEGSFGKVAKCVDTVTNEELAIKITKDNPFFNKQALKEAGTIEILKRLQILDHDMCHLVRWDGSFLHQSFICLRFELLDLSLFHYMQQRNFQPLIMAEIRPLLRQLTTSLLHLDSLGIIHADLKPENIMIVDCGQQPLQVKIIDFGLACHSSDAALGTCVQTLCFRAPEVMLGLVYAQPIDMWSLGLVAAELALGRPAFPAANDHEQTPDEFPPRYEYKFKDTRGFRSLNDLERKLYYRNKADRNEVQQLVDLLQKMLEVDQNERILPVKALEHPFFSVQQEIICV
ncbi:hypothetical protein Q5P01_026108 [Channa striata]|uniref:Protein kinase domain-containing protein n=1 Tax=Channa striata TaxID=64152 RepID=A0AA88LFU9_CHASR|nr:hypothetical protein Q5P01_026108 [Channa striata]